MESYLVNIKNNNYRIALTQFRLSAHNLEIEAGRHANIERNNRLCRLCNNGNVESEYHFLLICNHYNDLREKFLGNVSWANIHKFSNIMKTHSRTKQVKLAKFIKLGFQDRSTILQGFNNE